ncbi:MAG: oligosaccharide flippase family protein [Synechococcales cyanobacterium CRU_2_2]|nr:oligosaccharide flippase family protein [Synechococcales cyanobacterium CRU_2_2]
MSDQDLKKKILQGGIVLAIRQLITSVFSLVSVLVVARVLGPEKYGIVAIAMGIFYFLIWTNKLGIGVYVLRQTELPKETPRQILAFYNTLGMGLALLLWLLAPALGDWTKSTAVIPIIRFLALPLWLELLGNASIVMMERELMFAEIGLGETIGQMANYAVSLPLVLTGYGYWGPIIGLASQYMAELVFVRYHKPVPFQFHWRSSFIFPALQTGLVYTGATWILSLRTLTVTLFVTRFAGIEAAGIVSLAVRFADQLAVFRLVLNRMSISVLAKLLGDPDRIRSAISQGMVYQVLLVSPACATFACVSSWLIPLMFGSKWLPSAYLFPFIATGVMMTAMFELHSSALYAAGNNREVGKFNAGYVALQWLAAIFGLNLFGIWGYGMAELATLPSYGLIHQAIVKLCGAPQYRNALLLVLATLPALFAGPWLPSWVGLLLLTACYVAVFAISPGLRKILFELYGAWKGGRQALTED